MLLFISLRGLSGDRKCCHLSCGSKANLSCYAFALFASNGSCEVETLRCSTDTDSDDTGSTVAPMVCRDVNFSLVTKMHG